MRIDKGKSIEYTWRNGGAKKKKGWNLKAALISAGSFPTDSLYKSV